MVKNGPFCRIWNNKDLHVTSKCPYLQTASLLTVVWSYIENYNWNFSPYQTADANQVGFSNILATTHDPLNLPQVPAPKPAPSSKND